MWDFIVFTCQFGSDVASIESVSEKAKKCLHRRFLAHNDKLCIAQKKGVFDPSATLIVVEDTVEGIGSGGATLNALVVVTERLCVSRGLSDINPDVLHGVYILIMHLGRCPPGSKVSSGLLELPLEFVTETNYSVLLNVLIHSYRMLTERVVVEVPSDEYSVWVCGCDHLLNPDYLYIGNSGHVQGCDILAFSTRVLCKESIGHGIYKVNKHTNLLEDIEYGEHAGVEDNEEVDVVVGLMCFNLSATESLLRLSLISPIVRTTYMGTDTGESSLKLSLFLDLLLPTCVQVKNENCGDGAVEIVAGRVCASRSDSHTEQPVRMALREQLSHLTTKIVALQSPFLYLTDPQYSVDHLKHTIDEFVMKVDEARYAYFYHPEKGDWWKRMSTVLVEDKDVSLVSILKSLVLEGKFESLLTHLHQVAIQRAQLNANVGRVLSHIADVLVLQAGKAGGLRNGPAHNEKWSKPFALIENGDVCGGIVALSGLRAEFDLISPLQLTRLARHYDYAAQICIRKVVTQVKKQMVTVPSVTPVKSELWNECTAPARIDLAGGWSDTPPITFEHGGAVLNIAITVDHKNPIGARCRRTATKGVHCKLISLTSSTTLTIESMDELCYSQPSSPEDSGSLCDQLGDEGIELECWSNLPHGSGLGTSSILAGCILQVVWKSMGLQFDQNTLLHAVLYVEQLLTTGGGWQDQVGGFVPGIKIGRLAKSTVDPQITVEKVELSDKLLDELQSRLILVYTGKTRLAKNLLQEVIRNWYRREPLTVKTVQELVENAENCLQCVKDGNWDGMSDCIKKYRAQKLVMAPRSEPSAVTQLLETLEKGGLVSVGWLAGAGGGGFLYLLVCPGVTLQDIQVVINRAAHKQSAYRTMTVHSVSITR